MRLIGAVVDAGASLFAVKEGQDRIIGDTQGAMDLYCPVNYLLQDIGGKKLDGGDIHRGGALAGLVDFKGSMEHQIAGGVDLGAAFGNHGLNHLLLAELTALGDLTGGGALAHEVKGAFTDTDPAHAVMDAAGAESFLGQHESSAFRP